MMSRYLGPDLKRAEPSFLPHSCRSKTGAAPTKKLSLPYQGIGADILCLPISLLHWPESGFCFQWNAKITVRADSWVWGFPFEESKLSEPQSFYAIQAEFRSACILINIKI